MTISLKLFKLFNRNYFDCHICYVSLVYTLNSSPTTTTMNIYHTFQTSRSNSENTTKVLQTMVNTLQLKRWSCNLAISRFLFLSLTLPRLDSNNFDWA